jgi:hypothetical protein
MSPAIDKLKAALDVGRSALQTTLYLIVFALALVVVFSAGARARIAVAVTDMAAAGVESVKIAGAELKLREQVKAGEKAIVQRLSRQEWATASMARADLRIDQ